MMDTGMYFVCLLTMLCLINFGLSDISKKLESLIGLLECKNAQQLSEDD